MVIDEEEYVCIVEDGDWAYKLPDAPEEYPDEVADADGDIKLRRAKARRARDMREYHTALAVNAMTKTTSEELRRLISIYLFFIKRISIINLATLNQNLQIRDLSW